MRRPSELCLIIAVVCAVLLFGCGEKAEHHWSYAGDTGPAHWGDLKPEYILAKTGMRQSPIDLNDEAQSEVAALAVDYKDTAVNIVNNGHAIQVNYDPGSSVTVGSGRFELLQFHFHSPSEHTVGGKHFPLEMHLVHKNAAGKLCVIGVFFETGAENAALQKVWAHLSKATAKPRKIAGATVCAADLLPGDRMRCTYTGSLTTPPCTEDVTWLVMVTPLTASKAQLDAFRAFYDGNNRPTQPLNDRELRLGK